MADALMEVRLVLLVFCEALTSTRAWSHDEGGIEREGIMNYPNKLELRIDVDPMPEVWCAEPTELSLGLQSGRDDVVLGSALESSVRFDVSIDVKEGRGGNPDFTGPLVHGRPGERFLYLSWGRVTTDNKHDMFRRLKLYLSPVSRESWSSPGVTWEHVKRGSITTSVNGSGPDGTPHCGTVEVRWT